MALFEQRVSEDEVTAAREKIAAGASLRAAAAEIPCAASTLSTRIKKAEQAEDAAGDRARMGDNGHRAVQVAGDDPDLRALPAAAGAVPGAVGPVEILRGALLATKASGQADWPTRVSAARALAALCPEEVKPKPEHKPQPSTVVYDLPPGSNPVLHRARITGPKAPVRDAEAPTEQLPTAAYLFSYQPPDGPLELIGNWFPHLPDQASDGVSTVRLATTEDAETAERWRAELTAGRLPQTSEDTP